MLRAAGIGDDRKTSRSAVYSVRKKWHKMYYHFKPGKTYWIFIIVNRKMWIAFAGLMFRGSPGFQLAFVLMILFTSYVLQVQNRPYMSTAERHSVLEEHRKKAAEGDAVHKRIKPLMEQAIEIQKRLEDKKKTKKKRAKMKSWQDNGVVGEQFGFDQDKKPSYFWDYNTIEATLLACAVFVCLSGVMFESGRFDDRPDLIWMYDLIGVLVAIVLIYSLLYYLAVFTSEVLGQSPKWLEKCCANEKKGTFRDEEDNVMNDDFEMAEIHAYRLQGAAASKADKERLAILEAQMAQLSRVNQGLVNERRQKGVAMHDNPLSRKNKGRGRGRGGKKGKKKKEFSAKKTEYDDDHGGIELLPTRTAPQKKRRMSSRELMAAVAVPPTPVIAKKKTSFKQHATGEGKPYYESVDTGAVVWSLPDEGELIRNPQPSSNAPKGSHRRHVSGEGKTFYEDVNTGEVVWDLPEDGGVVVQDNEVQHNPMKLKRRSFQKIVDEEHGAYFQDVDTKETVWKLPKNGDVVL